MMASAGTDGRAVDDVFSIHDAYGESGYVILVRLVKTGHFSRFSGPMRAQPRMDAAVRHALDDLFYFFRHVLSAGDIVQEKQRLRACAHNVVNTHGDAVYADGIVLVLQKASFSFVPTPSVPETSTGWSIPVRSG